MNNYYQHIKHITINKCIVGFQKRKLLIVIAYRDYIFHIHIYILLLKKCFISF